MTTTIVAPEARRARNHLVADEQLLDRGRVGPVDRVSIEGILALLSALPD